MNQMCNEDMSLSITDSTVIKVVQATRNKNDIEYGTCRGIQCSSMFLISVSLNIVVFVINSI